MRDVRAGWRGLPGRKVDDDAHKNGEGERIRI